MAFLAFLRYEENRSEIDPDADANKGLPSALMALVRVFIFCLLALEAAGDAVELRIGDLPVDIVLDGTVELVWHMFPHGRPPLLRLSGIYPMQPTAMGAPEPAGKLKEILAGRNFAETNHRYGKGNVGSPTERPPCSSTHP
jgi:hypothetical protein